MKRMFKCFAVMLLLIISINKALASECSNKELASLKKEAANIKAVYEEKEGLVDPSTYENTDGVKEDATFNYFDITFSNINEHFYLEYKNNFSESKKRVTNSITEDGSYTFSWNGVTKITKIFYTVYASGETSCTGKKLYSGTLVLPKYNRYSETLMCEEAKELKECQKYIDEDIAPEVQVKTIEEYIAGKHKKDGENLAWYKKILNVAKEHKIIIISGTLIVAGVAVYVILKNRKGSDGL